GKLMGWWIALGILVLLAIIPIGVLVNYDEDGPLVKIVAGFIRFKVFPLKKKEKKPKKADKAAEGMPPQPQKEASPGDKPEEPAKPKPQKPAK
ncbi:hypothetical protein, partial [Klebsiella pneumoniae]|uniref:hypothetical protein n=1 Tax=Klebsiella pneumoniae TaxID=573 RepID=UPI001C8F75BE